MGYGLRVKEKKNNIKIINLHNSYRVNRRLVKKIALYALNSCKARGKTKLEIVFLSNRQIRPLNKKYKLEDRPTDVLSFELGDLGEIFISIDKAKKNSGIFNNSIENEFALYIIHGILHLTGYDDETPKERSRMEARQEEILKSLCKRESLSKVLTPR